ncbi:hypothetical protein BJX61DRAFT_550232 [Aspergillus egyptiacus]|nr:hypothetical protein BJX61DRAFT_550232 [Aspergillus egyptiacus]
MARSARADIIKTKPIGEGLSAFRQNLALTCKESGLACSTDSVRQLNAEVLQDLCLDLIVALQALPASRVLRSVNGGRNLLSDLLRLGSAVNSSEFHPERLIPLLAAVIDKESDETVWDRVYLVAAESTPPSRSLPFLGQAPYSHTISSFLNSSEHRKYVDDVLKEELGSIYIGVPGFYDAYFGNINGLAEAGASVLRRCKEGNTPLFDDRNGWRDWPDTAKEEEVLDWLSKVISKIRELATEENIVTKSNRAVFAYPSQPLQGSTAARKLNVSFVRNLDTTDSTQYHWSHVLVSGELKSSPSADTASTTWRDLGRYAREVLTAQDTRRFALGFTLCGPNMRLWEFDRVGAIASLPFNINKDGFRFISAMLGFLQMNDEQLGYDPSILSTSDGKRFINITRDGRSERLILDGLMKRVPCIAGRATTCWKAHRKGDEASIPLVIKDSWQYPEREEEGIILSKATNGGVINVARYYHHETVLVNGVVDDICNNVRRGLDVTQSTKYKSTCSHTSACDTADMARMGRSMSSAGRKRSSSCAGATLPLSKRPCSNPPSKGGCERALQNRVHRRVIVRDYGVPIYGAKTRVSFLSALLECIRGYESLHAKAGFLQGDISTGNLILNDDGDNPSWSAFLIDLDLSLKEQRDQPSGAKGKTGTRAFMAIGLLLGEKHSFMHDLESFFWVIFWICIYYDGPNVSRVVPLFDKWNFVNMAELAGLKKGTVAHEGDFISMANEYFTPFYKPLAPWVNRLRKTVFPGGGRWEKENKELFAQMQDVLRVAVENPEVQSE